MSSRLTAIVKVVLVITMVLCVIGLVAASAGVVLLSLSCVNDFLGFTSTFPGIQTTGSPNIDCSIYLSYQWWTLVLQAATTIMMLLDLFSSVNVGRPIITCCLAVSIALFCNLLQPYIPLAYITRNLLTATQKADAPKAYAAIVGGCVSVLLSNFVFLFGWGQDMQVQDAHQTVSVKPYTGDMTA